MAADVCKSSINVHVWNRREWLVGAEKLICSASFIFFPSFMYVSHHERHQLSVGKRGICLKHTLEVLINLLDSDRFVLIECDAMT